MTSVVTRTFRSGNSEAVALPEGLGFGEGVDLQVERTGNVVTLRPVPREWPHGERPNAALVARLRALTRPGDPIGTRDPFDDPKRPGL